MTTVPKIALTHAGKFHADDVFSAALLRLIYPDIQFQRVFSVPEDFDGLVFDIGWGKFDHHQSGAPVRENGVPYAAFGLLWKEYGSQLVGEEAQRFDEHFIQPLRTIPDAVIRSLLQLQPLIHAGILTKILMIISRRLWMLRLPFSPAKLRK